MSDDTPAAGQPEPDLQLIRFLLSVYEPWSEPPKVGGNGEWTGQVTYTYALAFYFSESDTTRSMMMLTWFRELLDDAFKSFFWGLGSEGYAKYILEAQGRHAKLMRHYDMIADQFDGRPIGVVLAEARANLPDWISPSADPEIRRLLGVEALQFQLLEAQNDIADAEERARVLRERIERAGGAV